MLSQLVGGGPGARKSHPARAFGLGNKALDHVLADLVVWRAQHPMEDHRVGRGTEKGGRIAASLQTPDRDQSIRIVTNLNSPVFDASISSALLRPCSFSPAWRARSASLPMPVAMPLITLTNNWPRKKAIR